uniref:SWIM-type domain-containing protein n=1 Tax=Oncorhynchus kisutch TaxID=8019 RepID=A0A8C7F9T3_ONCKI
VHPLNDVSAVVEDAPDVFSVHCAGEMGITIVPSVSTGCMYQKLITYEVLCPFDQEHYCICLTIIWRSVACKLWEILFNFRFPCQHLLYVLEEVEGLLQSVGLIVFPDHHIVAAAGHHEYNGRLTIKTLNPLSAFVPLTSNIKHTERGEKTELLTYSASQQVLIRTTTGYLLLCTVDQLVLIGSLEAGLHPLLAYSLHCMCIPFSGLIEPTAVPIPSGRCCHVDIGEWRTEWAQDTRPNILQIKKPTQEQ